MIDLAKLHIPLDVKYVILKTLFLASLLTGLVLSKLNLTQEQKQTTQEQNGSKTQKQT